MNNIIIVGSGPIGLLTALSLLNPSFTDNAKFSIAAKKANQIRVTIISLDKENSFSPLAPDGNRDLPSKSGRLFAISHHSWEMISAAISPLSLEMIFPRHDVIQYIKHIRVVDGETTAKIDFLPNDSGKEHFGVMIDEFILKEILRLALWYHRDRIVCVGDARVIDWKDVVGQVVVKISFNQAVYDLNISDFSNRDTLFASSMGFSADYEEKNRRDMGVKNNDIKCDIENRNLGSDEGREQTSEEYKGILLLACDGKNSTIRALSKVGVKKHDFKQFAMVFDIQHPHWHHDGVAVQKFCPTGPLAILPKAGGYNSSIVWTKPASSKIGFNDLTKEDIAAFLLSNLGGYLGDDIKISSPIHTYNLYSIIAKKNGIKRTILLGDSAHSIHPLAGQGFNLGLRDVEVIVKLIHKFSALGLDLGDGLLAAEYERRRKGDIACINSMTIGLEWLFSRDEFIIELMRRLGMKIFDQFPMLKQKVIAYAADAKMGKFISFFWKNYVNLGKKCD